jgi:hypothetical protein
MKVNLYNYRWYRWIRRILGLPANTIKYYTPDEIRELRIKNKSTL